MKYRERPDADRIRIWDFNWILQKMCTYHATGQVIIYIVMSLDEERRWKKFILIFRSQKYSIAVTHFKDIVKTPFQSELLRAHVALNNSNSIRNCQTRFTNEVSRGWKKNHRSFLTSKSHFPYLIQHSKSGYELHKNTKKTVQTRDRTLFDVWRLLLRIDGVVVILVITTFGFGHERVNLRQDHIFRLTQRTILARCR